MSWKLGVLVAVSACASEATTEQIDSELTTCVELVATGDATIAESQPRKTFGSKKTLHVGDGDESLVKFDLASVPGGAAITSATLKLYVSKADANKPIGVHRVKTAWNEATVTYQNFNQQFAHARAGAFVVAHDNVQKSVDLTDLVRTWIGGDHPNHGVLLESDACRDATLVSREGGTASQRPKLQICYTQPVDHCAANPCEHGSCTNRSSGFTCTCQPGYGGATCGDNLDDCASTPCQHGGTCSDGVAGYTCSCPAGFSGANCELDVDECAVSPCQHGGICTDGVAGYTCACPSAFTGENCEIAVDNCASSPCDHGTCSTTSSGFVCTCDAGYAGANCEIDIDDCASNACVNGGTCVDGVGSYSCACPPDFGGARCETNLNTCAQQPCLNGGACVNGAGTYTCVCATGFTGGNCEVDLNDCSGAQCENGGVCVDGVASYTCACPDGYTGDHCELPPPPRPVRIDGVCTAICQRTDSDPNHDGWGWEGHICVTPDSSMALNSPWCDSPEPPEPYEAPNASVDESTTSVAQLPRPPRVIVEPAHGCPYDQPGLIAWNPGWQIGSDVSLPPGARVLVRGSDWPASIGRLYVPPTSELIFADEPATIRITDLVVDGALRLGSPTCRLESAISFELDTAENVASPTVRQAIYSRMGLGVMVGPNGVLDLFGHLYQPTWTRLAATAQVGTSQLSLAEAVDWRPGQTIVVATGARVDYPYADENELRVITAVTGSTITIDRPLTFRHYAGPEYQIEVGLLSRNIEFHTSARVATAAPTFGGHIMVHSKHAHVSGVELRGLGQQNFLARYPFHWHRSGDVGNASFFTDSSVWKSNYRCAVVHRTDRAIVSRNVAFDNWGHCYYLEDGIEMNNELSFNLAVRTKVLGAVDDASLLTMRWAGQEGFTAVQSPELAQPADRAAAGFYITNGNNKIVGNASSGGFSGYSLPNLPKPIGGDNPDRIFPILYGASHFDGNTAHSSGYLWAEGGACVYIGGTLVEVDGHLEYTSGRSTVPELLRRKTEVFNNTKTFLCETGIVHWGSQPRIVNFEAWNNGLLAKLFGSASIQSTVVVGRTGDALPRMPGLEASDLNRPWSWWTRGFQFYDTGTQTILRDVVFRNFRHDAFKTAPEKEFDNCALLSMTHSNQWTPQQMNTVAGIHFATVDENQKLCVTDRGTLSSRNFNIVDADGSLSGSGSPRVIGSLWSTAWGGSACAIHEGWGAQICPLHGIASIGVIPDADVRVSMYALDGTPRGDNWYSSTEFAEAQITGPSAIGWHHDFPNGVPPSILVRALQVPDFVVLSFTLPPNVKCAIHAAPWTEVANVTALLASTSPTYTTQNATCFVRIPPTNIGAFQASGLSVPNMTWGGIPTATTYFDIDTGCAGNPACQTVVSTLPVMP